MRTRRDVPPAARAATLLSARLKKFYREIPRALAGDEEGVHQLRVSGRRLRVALPLLAKKPDGKRVRRAVRRLRDVTRAAGGSRDLDVGLDLLEKRAAAGRETSVELGKLITQLRTARTRSRHRLAESLLDLDLAGLRRDLRAVQSRGPASPEVVLLRVHALRELEGALLLAGLAAVGRQFAPDELHRLRRRVRRLRYAAELCDELRDMKSNAEAGFKALQEDIGEMHDHHVLAGRIGAMAGAARRRGNTPLADESERQRRWAASESRNQHRALLDSNPVARATGALRELAPLTGASVVDMAAAEASAS